MSTPTNTTCLQDEAFNRMQKLAAGNFQSDIETLLDSINELDETIEKLKDEVKSRDEMISDLNQTIEELRKEAQP